MCRSLIAMTAVLLSGVICGANKRPFVVQDTIHATPEKIKKATLAMFAPDGYKIASDSPSQLKISRAISDEEIARYNTENWTKSPVANCRRVHTLTLLPGDQATNVTMDSETVCHTGGTWLIRRNSEKDIQWMQTALADLKAKIEGVDQRR